MDLADHKSTNNKVAGSKLGFINGQAVRSVYGDTGTVLDCAAPGTIVIEMSSVTPETSQQLFKDARKRGIEVLDLAVSGSTAAAESGALTPLGGGERDTFETVASIFSSIAKQCSTRARVDLALPRSWS
jgi:3-hydroxyisobutyrate dehydrogenase-like beta-hydroxyacid dehydrogenase